MPENSKSKHKSIGQKLFLTLLFLVVFSMIAGNAIWIYLGSVIPHWVIVTFSLIIGTIWSAIVSLWFSRWFAKPIKKLHEGAEIIGQGNLDYKVDIKTNDEIEQLANKFNEMTKKLKSYYSGLEEAVAERTKDLESAKNNLEKSNKELGKFNRLTISREIKMIDLKKEIKALKDKNKR